MSRTEQRTIASEVTLEGVGVHSGVHARLTLRPADPDSGLRFRRVDLEGAPEVPADVDHVVDSDLGTTLAVGGARIGTVEHLLAALHARSIDNVVIDIDGPEIPIRDGSFQDFFDAVTDAGVVEQGCDAEVITLPGVVQVSGESDKPAYVATPIDGLRISATIDFEHAAIGRQYGSFLVTEDSFASELASARTFGFEADAEGLRARGLALGSSLDNSIILGENEVVNDGLRFDDEFLRHKVGDIVGDLALLGARLNAHVIAERSSHAGNVELARAIRREVRRSGPPVADITKIMEFLPHRYPMLLIDRILDVQAGKSIVGIKNVTINEPFFQGHYPGHPIMPGVLIIEAMAQCGGLLLMDEGPGETEKVVYFMTMDKVKFRRPVTPGDTIVFEVEVLQLRRGTCRMAGRGLVDGKVVAEAEFMARIMDK